MFGDEDMILLAHRIPDLLWFKLSGCNVKDDGIRAIVRGCGNITELEICNRTGTYLERAGNCLER
jgi:hypothetical protein